MNDITALTPEKLDEIRQRYRPVAAPKCHICGAEMTIGAASATRVVYACSGATYDDAGCHYAPGRSIADDHYAQSRVTVVDVSDPDVLALVETLEKAQKLATQQGNIACALFDEVTAQRQRIAELEGAEQKLCAANVTLDARAELAERRLAELESRTVTVKLYDDFQLCHYGATEDYAKGYIDSQNNFTKWLAAAGIQVIEGEGQ
ncbi:ead/Ea22-like family protein [Kluyvera ascorbata]|uniref:ead/Ea22-like family protein n=1 Tax=Kluyvera ascorbata TaxID=51288 RepID=UPI00350EF468